MSSEDATRHSLNAAAASVTEGRTGSRCSALWSANTTRDAAASTSSSCHEAHILRPTHDAAAAKDSTTQPAASSEPCSTAHNASPASAALLAANQRLLAARVRAKKERLAETQEQGSVVVQAAHDIESAPFHTDKGAPSGIVSEVPTHAAAIIAALPEHLGWESGTLAALLRRRQAQTRETAEQAAIKRWSLVLEPGAAEDGCKANPVDSGCVKLRGLEAGCVGQNSQTHYTNSESKFPTWLKLYPSLGVGLLRRNLTAPGRLWLFLRALDQQGRGRLPLQATRDALVTATSPLRFCGARQWRNLLRAGEGIFWTWDEENIWLKATAKVALALGVARLTGQPVAFPVAALREGVGLFRAHLYAAFHSGRCKETARGRHVMPLSRASLTELSGVGASSQRSYEKQTHLPVQSNFAVGEVATAENGENRAWQQGQAIFTLTDYRGRQGPKGQSYLAWQLPNSYIGQHLHRPKGRQKRINRQLKDLVMQGMPGNRSQTVATPRLDRRYYGHGKEVAQLGGRGASPDVYWQRHRLGDHQSQLWQQLPWACLKDDPVASSGPARGAVPGLR